MQKKYLTNNRILFFGLGSIGQRHLRLISNNYINPVILEGDEMILLDCEKTKFPEHYNEGVYAWMENRKICTTLEYHESKGGDPEVLHAWLKGKGKNPDFHPMK